MCQCLMANVPSLWVCEIHTCEHTSCPPRREPSDLLLVADLMKWLSFAVSVATCTSHTCRCWKCTPVIPSFLFGGWWESIISGGINEPVTLTIGVPFKPVRLNGLQQTVESVIHFSMLIWEPEDTSDIQWPCNIWS